MPLKKGKDRDTQQENIREVVHKWEDTGRIGTSRPRSKAKAIKQAVAISYDEARRSGAKIPKKGASAPKLSKGAQRNAGSNSRNDAGKGSKTRKSSSGGDKSTGRSRGESSDATKMKRRTSGSRTTAAKKAPATRSRSTRKTATRSTTSRSRTTTARRAKTSSRKSTKK